jgi:hypothetical protein
MNKEKRHRTYTGHYGRLEEHEVFVFGSNMDGYHGSGNAGYACHGAMKLYEPDTVIDFANTPDNWKGAYAIKGYNEGMMKGRYGWSYAIPTVLHAGDRQSIPKEQLIKNIQSFYDECRENQDMEFILAYGAEPHLRCGYTLEEFVKLFVDADDDIPKNIVFNENFYKILTEQKMLKEAEELVDFLGRKTDK